jgi:chromosome segregation ATPase
MLKTPKTLTKDCKSISIPKSKSASKTINKRKASFDNFSKPVIHKVHKEEYVELDSIGEEGIPQVVRSPIAKRESAQSADVFLKTVRNLREVIRLRDQDEISELKQENKDLKKQLLETHQSLQETKQKLVKLQNIYEKIEKLNIEILEKNTFLNEELEKTNKKLKTFEKNHLQEELEQKILTLFREKEENYSLFQNALTKLNQYLCEFASCEEWVLSLVSSPFIKKEIEENEEILRIRIEKIKSEIISCQSHLKSERFIDKSYFTSISSSMIQSPIPSPNLH